ncbi:MAG TPA: ThuA domain-containing protein [Steroidobacteraceae bacterium]|nr:ThuA domain-containing protein [Steroidobacteraceae bacterium]
MTSSRALIGSLCVVLGSLCTSAGAIAASKGRVLVYFGHTGYVHESIPAAVEALKKIGAREGYAVDTSEDPEVFAAAKLADYKAIVLVSNSTDPKKPESEWFTGSRLEALQGFLAAGKGVIGLHAAADSHYHTGWYGRMIGGYFERHPKGTPKATITVVDARHPATAKLPSTITRNDEWYYYKDFDPTVRVLVTVDPSTIGDGEADVNPNALVWCHDFGGGRVFYSGLGHTPENYSEPYIVDMLTGALKYAVGR